MENKEYYILIVGPFDSDKIPQGAEIPMRTSISNALDYLKLSQNNVTYWSGWGLKEEKRIKIMKAWR